MKVNQEEKADRYGAYPYIRVSGKDANPQNIHEWLYRHCGYGYKFVLIFDCTADEFEEPEKETPVYHMDAIDDEIMEYIGVERVKQWLKQKYEGRFNEHTREDFGRVRTGIKIST